MTHVELKKHRLSSQGSAKHRKNLYNLSSLIIITINFHAGIADNDAGCGFYRPDAICQQVVSSLLNSSSCIKSVNISLAAPNICRLAAS